MAALVETELNAKNVIHGINKANEEEPESVEISADLKEKFPNFPENLYNIDSSGSELLCQIIKKLNNKKIRVIICGFKKR